MFFWCSISEKYAYSGLDILKAIEIDHISGGKKEILGCVSALFLLHFSPLFLPAPGQKRDKLCRVAVISNVTIPNSTGLNSSVACIYLSLLKYLT